MPNARRVIARFGIAAALLLSAIVSQPELLHGRATPSLPLNGAIVRVSTESELQAAVQNLTSNTTILLAPGVYTLSSTVWVRGPLSGVAIRGDSNTSDDVVLVGQGMSHASYGLVPYGIAAGGNVDDVTIANLTIRDTYRQAVVFDPSVTRPHLFNVHVIDAGDGMVLSAAGADYRGVASGIIEFSTFEYTNGVRSLGTLAIDLRGVTGWIIRDNMFRNIVGQSRQLAGPAIAVHAMSRDTLTEENTFTNVSQGIAYGLVEQGGTDHTGGFIRNNIFFRTSQQPGGAGIMINDSPGAWIVNNTLFVSGTYGTPIEYRYPGARDVVVANNLLDGRVWAGDGATAIESHNYEGATADMFMDASKGDLHLSAAAVGAIDRGVATEAATQDIDGQIRPIGSGYDIGADEREGRGRVTAAATSSVSIHGHVYSSNGTTLPGSIVTLSGSRSATATADPAGAFAFEGLAAGGSYTVTPARSGYSFQPASAFYGSLGSNVSNVIFWGSTSSAAPPAPAPPAPVPPAPAPPAPTPPVTTTPPPVVVTPTPTASVQLTAPKNLTKYFAPAAVTITATGTNLTSVKFYANSSLIGTSGSPYSLNWTAVPAGTYSLKAVGVDAKGLTVDSSPVQIVVEQPAPPTPPTVSISAPKATDTFTAPATITINAGASSTSSTIARVDFYAGATLVGSDTLTPFATTWSNVPAGSYSLTAVATDKAGIATRSSAVNITVSAPNVPPPPPPVTSTPPIVSLTSPADGSAFTTPATVVITADASSSGGTLATTSTTGVAKVEIYAGATLIGSDTVAPFGVTWSNMAPGTYSLTAVATNSAGQSTRSAAVNVTIAGPVVVAPTPVGGGLVQPGNLVYQGSFRVPFGGTMKVPGTDRGFDYGGSAPAYNPVNNTLFLVSHVYDQQTAELNIPSSLGTGAVSSWPVATVRTPFTDVLEGQRPLAAVGQGDPTTMIGGQLVYGGELFVQPYVYYGDTNAKSHWRRSPDLNAKGTLQGPFAVGPMGPDFYTGYMGLIPPDWQSALGGPVLNGQCCLSIISRTSFGPSVSAMDPKQLGPTTVSASALVAYPSTHKTLGDWGTPGTNAYFNGATQIKGVVFPFGTSSVLFFGKHGLGNYCYGEGSACNDPEDGDKGDHAYPYAYYVWAYDAHDLAAVHSGQKQPWDIRPYAVWQLTLPAPSRAHRLGGVAYDPATGRLFISQQFVDGDSGDYPVVHVYVIR